MRWLLALWLLARASHAAARPLPAEGMLEFEVRDAGTGELMPAKVTVLGARGTPDPRFTRGDVGREEEGAVSAYNRVYSATGSGAVRVPAGNYDVCLSRGLEWERELVRNVRVDARGARVQARLRHSVDTPGWLSADFHVHAARSADSRVPMIDRVYEFVADGIDMIVSTDHNALSDYAPLITEVGVGRHLTSAIGDELTTNGWGHFGAFPLPHTLEGHGAFLVHGRSAADFFHDVRVLAPEAIIDVHHPRIDAEIGYFNAGGFDSALDEAARPGFSFDFDAIEVLNGYQDPERRNVERMIQDWFALLDHGHLVTATGNSDTHHLTHNIAGYPRNYVAVAHDRPDQASTSEVARAVKGHHALFTTGPFIDARLNGASIGDLVAAPGGRAHLEIAVRAASWVAVTQVRVYVDGKEHTRLALKPSTDAVRLRQTLELELTRDSYVVIRAEGDRSLTPVVGDDHKFTVYPLALTNPFFVDVDGNHAFDQPLVHGRHHHH